MDITVSARHIDLPDGLARRVATRLGLIAREYFDHAREASVTFRRARSFFTCDIDVHARCGLTLRGEGEAGDANTAFDDAVEHIARRLRRYRRAIDRNARGRPPPDGRAEMAREVALLETGDGGDERGAFATAIAETRTEIERLTVREAVLRLDLADKPVLMFRNQASGELNVVHRRPDGLIGWIDPVDP